MQRFLIKAKEKILALSEANKRLQLDEEVLDFLKQSMGRSGYFSSHQTYVSRYLELCEKNKTRVSAKNKH